MFGWLLGFKVGVLCTIHENLMWTVKKTSIPYPQNKISFILHFTFEIMRIICTHLDLACHEKWNGQTRQIHIFYRGNKKWNALLQKCTHDSHLRTGCSLWHLSSNSLVCVCIISKYLFYLYVQCLHFYPQINNNLWHEIYTYVEYYCPSGTVRYIGKYILFERWSEVYYQPEGNLSDTLALGNDLENAINWHFEKYKNAWNSLYLSYWEKFIHFLEFHSLFYQNHSRWKKNGCDQWDEWRVIWYVYYKTPLTVECNNENNGTFLYGDYLLWYIYICICICTLLHGTWHVVAVGWVEERER